MTFQFALPDLPIHFTTKSVTKGANPVSIDLVVAPEKPSPGLPGKQTGDFLLAQSGDSLELLVSLGASDKIIPDTFRQAGGSVGKWLRQSGAKAAEFKVSSDEFDADPSILQAFLEGVLLGAYRFESFKKESHSSKPIAFYLQADRPDPALTKLAERVTKMASIVYLARDWAHEPANIINPETLAERVSALAGYAGLKCRVVEMPELEEMGAGGLVNVGKGSKTPSRLIVLEYAGQNPAPGAKPVVLVGKALTFDSGGYSLKTTEGIQGMKYDKCGGLAVAATLLAAAELKYKSPLVGVIGAAENMVSAEAYRPDDILTMLSGKTVEIVSTDAEGRLVLADALTYSQRNFKPSAIIDLATLTGGVMVALGRVRAGLMANNDELAQALLASGEATHERLWRLPLDDDYFNLIKGDDADIKNSGGREAHSVMGGKFLEQFIDDGVKWAHLDIAAVADLPKDSPYCPKGATGFGIRLLVDYLENLK